MSIQVIDPLVDDRWVDLLSRHPSASAFHQRGWLQALHATYKYEPIVLTTAPVDETLSDGIVLCRVSSWLTGTRLVSLPFADHCQPLLSGGSEPEFTEWLQEECRSQSLKYVELRPLSRLGDGLRGWQSSRSYCFHELDISDSSEMIFQRFHRDSIQRKIRRAQKEGLSYEAGKSEKLVNEFYRLLLVTRRRHGLLPQPRQWFQHLVQYMGESLCIRVARDGPNPVAAILSIRQGPTATYKYGCSDERYHSLGGMPFLFWKLVQESKAQGVVNIDFGRSDLDNKGLITFKNKLGATQRLITYYRSPHAMNDSGIMQSSKIARRSLMFLPDSLYSAAGGLLYRHMG
ncbi:MAG TPA: GNAT family N-acetyltransferase [Silvibacterium sp.]|nr:GNAT family N-acetyltransferase [Silvibacterium sp.]